MPRWGFISPFNSKKYSSQNLRCAAQNCPRIVLEMKGSRNCRLAVEEMTALLGGEQGSRRLA